jgi:3-oxoacyl-[acyl-carrier protein] reductase
MPSTLRRGAVTPENRVAVVTGAARGIGHRVALTLADRGYAVAANDLAAPEGPWRS